MLIPNTTLESKIGEGTFSEVFRGRRDDQTVAVKLVKLPSSSNGESILASLRYEFWVLKDLHHPNIVRLFDFGELPDKRIYLIEEYCDGHSLDVFCSKNSFSICESVFEGLLQGLAELHRWQVIHGDIKPANIQVTSTRQAKILDLGLSRNQQKKNESALTGTPATLAPEVILGQNSTPQSDLYSLGVTLYTALTGKNPFLRDRLEDTLSAHLDHTAEPIGLHRHDVPPPWADLIHRLLAKNPANRPESALKALQLVRKGHFTLAPTPFIGRKTELAQALSLISKGTSGKKIALIVTGQPGMGVSRFLREIFYQWIGNHPSRREEMALVEREPIPSVPLLLLDRLPAPAAFEKTVINLQPLSREETEEWLSQALHLKNLPIPFVDHVMEFTQGVPRSLWELLTFLTEKEVLADATGRVTPTTLKLIDWKGLFTVRADRNFEWILQETRQRLSSRRLLESDPVWSQLQELAEKGEKEERLQKKSLLLALQGEALIDEGKLEAAKEKLTAALEIFRNEGDRVLDELKTRNFLAYIALRQGRANDSVKQFEDVLAETKKLKSSQADQITNLDLGLAHLQAGQYQKATHRLKEELAFHHRQIKEGSPSAAARELSGLYNLALAHTGLEQLREAEEYFRDVLQKARALHDPAFILRAANGLGSLLQDTERWREGLDAYAQALEVALAIKDFVAAAAISQNKGVLEGNHSLYEEGLRDLENSLRFLEKIPRHYAYEKTLTCRSHLETGNLLLKQGQADKARDDLNRAWHLAEKDEDLKDFRYWVLLARCQAWLTLKDEAAFKKDLAQLHFYADDDSKKKQAATLQQSLTQNKTDTMDSTLLPQLEALLRINADLAGDMSLEELLKRLLGHAIELSGAELGVILLTDDKGELIPRLSLNAELNEDLCDISLSVAKQALARGEPITSADATHDKDFNQYASVMALNLKSILGLPIIFRGRVLGVLYLSHRYRPGLFQERATAVLLSFAQQAALALTNHKLLDFYKKSQEQLKEELEETRLSLTLAQEQIRSLPAIQRKITEGPLKTRSSAVIEILDQVERLADSNVTLIIHGETGTGKELCARYLHEASPRRKKPFIAVNCGAIPATLIESELFGHARGAFTGADRDKVGLIEAAHGGTLFLDEVADLSLDAQVRLLRVLQEREVQRVGETKTRPVDIRVVAASHRPLQDAVEKKEFREDLYYRLSGLEVSLPSLAERPEDIPLLVDFFLKETLKESSKKQPTKIAPNLLKVVTKYSWPGNIRELRNFIQAAVSLTDGKILNLESVPKYLKDRLTQTKPQKSKVTGVPVGWYHPGKTWKEHELLIYVSALIGLDFDMPRIASSLSVGIATVYKWLRENKIREKAEDWKKQTLAYTEGTKLEAIRRAIFTQAAARHPGHPYYAAQELDVSPVTFYRWSRDK